MKLFRKIVIIFFGVLLLLAVGIISLIYIEMHSDHEFSATDFEHTTGISMPPSAQILKGESLNWDVHGDHDACAIIRVSPKDFKELEAKIHPTSTLATGGATTCSVAMYAEFSKYASKRREEATVAGGHFRSWSLADEEPVVMVQYSSW
jgi:hypothetical protein